MTQWDCGYCSQKITNNEAYILCHDCQEWHHTLCIPIMGKEIQDYIQFLPKEDNAGWMCRRCMKIATKFQKYFVVCERRLDEIDSTKNGNNTKWT